MSNLYAIFLFVSFLVLAADAVKCLKSSVTDNRNDGDDIENTCDSEKTICKYTGVNDATAGTGLIGDNDCIQDERFHYPCVKEDVCYMEAKDDKPTANKVYETCKPGTGNPPACEVKKVCLTGPLTNDGNDKNDEETTCNADVICKYEGVNTATAKAGLTGNSGCISDKRFYYPCVKDNNCYIEAQAQKTKLPTSTVYKTCNNASECKVKKVCHEQGDIASANHMDCPENKTICKYKDVADITNLKAGGCVKDANYKYPCVLNNECYIAAEETSLKNVKTTCKEATECRENGEGNTDKPGGNTEKPGGNTDKPGGNTEKPGGNTEKPGGNTDKPDGANRTASASSNVCICMLVVLFALMK